jgi:cobalt-zinc-cadmium efflux system membrane fusion protein
VDVATKAVFLRNNQHFVFVETARGQFERREIKLGLESNGRSVVVEGLMAGQRVVTEGCLLLESLLDGESS